MKWNFLDNVLKFTVKCVMPADCPDEIVDHYYEKTKIELKNRTSKVKNKVKSIFKFKTKKK